MYFQFLVEDISGEKLIDAIMQKYMIVNSDVDIEYKTRHYKGIGGLPKGLDARNTKVQQLLNDLPKRLKAFNVSLKSEGNAYLVVVLDNDTRDTALFNQELNEVAYRENITIDHVFCIAVEEMEAWLLGDYEAIKAAYPNLADRITTKHSNYKQDSICGTWEFLADLITRQGIGYFRKQNPTAFDIGKCKSEWAESIGQHLNISRNVSPSFQYFISALDSRLRAAS